MPSQAAKYGWKKGDLQMIDAPEPTPHEKPETQGTITEHTEEK
jgi:hypothetical protein